MGRPIKFMDETELREEAKRLKELVDDHRITYDGAIRFSNIRAALKVIERVRKDKSPLEP